MTIREALCEVEAVLLPASSLPVHETAAAELERLSGRPCRRVDDHGGAPRPGELRLGVIEQSSDGESNPEGEWYSLELSGRGSGELVVSRPHLLFSALRYLWDRHGDDPAGPAARRRTAFSWHRPVYDSLLTQLQRNARGMDWRDHIRAYALMGLSHLEVNALSTPHGMEPGVPGEVYPAFYTYCPALDQFSSSFLNRGCYPEEYLAANMALLERNAREALRYGMTPGLLCFEPRSVPDGLLRRYPMLRGARVDHPFRSFRPRYTLALAHPVARRHYRELVLNILARVPQIGYISVMSNDSGSGFEFTRSLYVGANGGPYLIREWKSVAEVARAAAANAMSFYRLLRDAAAEVNPRLRVIFRLEPFGDERPFVLDALEERLDVEGASFEHTGYGFSYRHERYPDVASIQNTVWHNRFRPTERSFIDSMAARGGRAHAFYTVDGFQNFDPLLGIPCPWMIHEKLTDLRAAGASSVGMNAGMSPPCLAPFDVNREVIRAFQHEPDLPLERTIRAAAVSWAGEALAGELEECWKAVQESIRSFPPPGLYASWGMAWYRLWVRPLVPDIEAISESDRAYYERFLLATPHNPNRIDLNRDILFELGGPDLASRLVSRIDEHALPPLGRALAQVGAIAARAGAPRVFADLDERLRGLECWMVTQRNTQAWIAGVHGYLRAADEPARRSHRAALRAMADSEIASARKLLELWRSHTASFMAVAELGESVHLMGENLGEHLERKIRLMESHRDDEPRVDPDFMWRVPGLAGSTADAAGLQPVTGQLEDA